MDCFDVLQRPCITTQLASFLEMGHRDERKDSELAYSEILTCWLLATSSGTARTSPVQQLAQVSLADLGQAVCSGSCILAAAQATGNWNDLFCLCLACSWVLCKYHLCPLAALHNVCKALDNNVKSSVCIFFLQVPQSLQKSKVLLIHVLSSQECQIFLFLSW